MRLGCTSPYVLIFSSLPLIICIFYWYCTISINSTKGWNFYFSRNARNPKIFETLKSGVRKNREDRGQPNWTKCITNKSLKQFFDAVTCSQQYEHWSMIFKTGHDSCHWHQETPGKTVWHGLRTEVDISSLYRGDDLCRTPCTLDSNMIINIIIYSSWQGSKEFWITSTHPRPSCEDENKHLHISHWVISPSRRRSRVLVHPSW